MAKKLKSDAAGSARGTVAGKTCSILPDTVLGDDVALVAENMERILTSPSYSLAQDDPALLTHEEMRGVRMLLELGKPEIGLQADNIKSTVIVFGGTQIVDRTAAERRLSDARRAAAAAPGDRTLARATERAEKLLAMSRFYDDARKFARIVSIDNQCEDERDYVVITGGGPGIMEAANRGAFDVGAKSIGLNITLPFEQEPNSFISPELCFEFKYFAIRKMHFLMRAKAMVAFPGGFGTMDELFEALTLIQTRRMQPIPVVLFGRDYWRRIVDWELFVEEGMISPDDLDLIHYAETAQECWQVIQDFYREKPPERLPRGQ